MVAALAQRPGFEQRRDEANPRWNEALVSAIHEFKERRRDSPDLGPAVTVASEDLYGRDVHWALELIRNAEQHLTDGLQPTVTAVFNPVRDDNVDQSPVGKMRVSGWRSAVRQERGSFMRITN
jgi:hypothetical protein